MAYHRQPNAFAFQPFNPLKAGACLIFVLVFPGGGVELYPWVCVEFCAEWRGLTCRHDELAMIEMV
jgi:hypothetical protein